jgi:aminoglycoside phosphotransferase (APT) family kinase protein
VALNIPLSQTTEIEVRELAQGEYNKNYVFVHPVTNKKLVLRVNTGSQMHLDNQIEYEYNALRVLLDSGCTPEPYFVDNSKELLPYGVLVMAFLEGRPLDYRKDMKKAAEILADIHAVPVPEKHSFVVSRNPIGEILEECDRMFRVYEKSTICEERVREKIRYMLESVKSEKKMDCLLPRNDKKAETDCLIDTTCFATNVIINTELNSGNFLINEKGKPNYLIDWEKPLVGDPAQDLGHFLAPTTTNWKTDVILKPSEVINFIDLYVEAVNGRIELGNIHERVGEFIKVTCLRGLTWSAMALVEYENPNRVLSNKDTHMKIKSYLKDNYLDMIEAQYIKI